MSVKGVRVTADLLKDISPSTFSKLKARVGLSGSEVVRVGVPSGAKHKSDSGKGADLVTIAAAQNYGVPPHLPARPFMSPPLKKAKPLLIKLNRINLLKVIHGKMSVRQALDQLGIFAVGQIRAYIRTKIPPPLALSTLRARGRVGKKALKAFKKSQDLAALQDSATPLVNTGQFINSITHVVKGREHV